MTGRGDLRRTLALFRRFSTGQRWMFSAAGALLTLEAATAVYQPTLLGALINFLKGHRRWSIGAFTPAPDSTIQVLAIVIIIVTAVNSMADSLAEIVLAKGGRTIGYHLRVALFGHLQRLSLTFHLHRKAGDVLTRITSDVQALEEFVVDSVSDLAGSFLLLIGTVGWLLYKSVQVALLALVIIPVLAVVSNYFASRIKAASKQLRAREGDLASTAQEMLTSISVVQIYGRGDYEQDRFAHQSRSAMDAVLRTARLEAAFGFTVSVLEAGVIAAVVWIGALLIHPAISAGLLVTFILQIQNMFKPTRRIIKEWNTVGKIYASVERIGELFDRDPAVIDRPGATAAPRFRGEIEFRDVSFAYQPEGPELSEDAPVRLALSGLSFRVAPGDVVALVGHSGAGKSTIAQLLPRLYDPHAGAVLLDGTDIRQFTIASLRSQIAMVLQETVLFSGTVAENIAYGRPDASRDQIEQAAQQAHAHDFIMALAEGYDTVLGERAATLSGGQRQRLAIARGFIRDAPILILDEPTTGLDAESARGVLAALRTLVQGRSALIVSHDFKLIRSVDRILVLSAGRILEEGTPEDLLARGGLYAELYAREFGDFGAAAGPPAAAHRPAHDEEPVEAQSPAVLRFERALTHAVPQPATAEMFRALSGRSPARGQRPLAERDLDPMLSPALNRALPGLAEALDAEAMGRHLQRMIAEGWDLDWCAPGRVLVRPGEGVSLRYVVGLRENGTGRTTEHIAAARMFPAVEMAEHWLANQVSRLADGVTERPDLAPFALLATGVWPLRMVLHAFPIDPDRPGLMAATDPAGVSSIFAQALGEGPADLTVASSRYEVVRYDRDRCVLRYEILWHLGSTGRTLKQVVYGKLYSDEQGGRVGPAIAAVRAHIERPGHPRPFIIPRLRGYLPELRLTLLDAVPGTAQLSSMIRSAVTDPASRPVAEAMLDSSAGIAASLHDMASVGGPVRSLRSERDAVRAEVAAIASLAPALAESLMAGLAGVDEMVAEHDPVPATFGHGDLTPGQFLFDGPLLAMVDFDSSCVAEPALDLGRFTSQLAVTAGKAITDAGGADAAAIRGLSQRFLNAYLYSSGAADPDELVARTAAYRRLSLTRIAVHSWRQLKLVRVVAAQRLLDQDALLAPGGDRIAGRPARR